MLAFILAIGLLFHAGAPPPPYSGACDVLTGGCAEAWNLQRAAATAYHGPLLQIENTTNSQTLNIPQTGTHSADVSGVPAFCGSSTTSGGLVTYPNCLVTIIYAQVHGSANNMVPSVFNGPYGPDCTSGGANKCACIFTEEVSTGLPILNATTTPPCMYTMTGDANAVGITAGTSSISVLYEGLAQSTIYCCGPAGIGHAYNVSDVFGTTFYQSVAYGQYSSSSAGNWCQQSATYCAGADEESIGDLVDYSPTNVGNVFAASAFNSTGPTMSGYVNGGMSRTPILPAASFCNGCAGMNLPTSVHAGGGGDLSQPAPAQMRSLMFTNNAVSQASFSAAYANIKAFYAGKLTYTDFATPSTAVTVVQKAAAQNGSAGATTKTINFGSATGTTKHGVAVSLFWCISTGCGATNTADVISSVAVGSNTCNEVPHSFLAGPSGYQTEVWNCPNLSSSATTVTVTTNGTSVSYLGVFAAELSCPTSGCVADQGGSGSANNNSWYCNAVTNGPTTQTGEFLYSIAASSQSISPRGISGLTTTVAPTLQDQYAVSGPSGVTYASSWLMANYSGQIACSVAAIEP